MKASVELRDKREARLRQQLQDTPMRPLPLFQLTGWTHFVDEEVKPPVLAAGSSPATGQEEGRTGHRLPPASADGAHRRDDPYAGDGRRGGPPQQREP
jgi:hypothetical protein